jgi:hypothetical protein
MAYGYEVRNPHDRKVVASKKILQLVSEKVAPGSLLVNEIPFCEYPLRDRDNIDPHPH